MRKPIINFQIIGNQELVDKYGNNRVTVEIEWVSSYLLSNPNYTVDDDTLRRHIMQMR